MNTDYCQHLTRYRLSDIMRIPICLLAFIFAGNGIATAQVSPFVRIRSYRTYGRQHPLVASEQPTGVGDLFMTITYVRGG